jgi:hypothetical protein
MIKRRDCQAERSEASGDRSLRCAQGDKLWPLLLGGIAGAAWMLVWWHDPAWANDCAQYLKNPKAFTGNLRGLIEDCMRTGYAGAVTTIILGGIGGGLIAGGVGKVLTGRDAGFTLPGKDPGNPDDSKPDGPPADPNAPPEGPPDPRGRDSVPEQCRKL